jgi:Flp pilus assembly protein TadG
MRKLRHNVDGQALVEFALVLPLLAVLLFGVIQFGIALNNYVTLTDAVRAGAREASVSRFSPTPGTHAEGAVRDAAVNLDQGALAVTVTSSWVRGDDVHVVATYPYEIDLIGVVVASGSLKSETTERVE